ncbi:phosphoribosylaminoimidazolesuccinocarboxamide synthase [Candidatus Binatia bacterium]|jgi:phosphoribosylaminoimidazole-succinocarboxamide synthase|nr:phosphoribosylaminoimidazolesuccinocarboxamide synthase [Candidatus Binatia bacterium]
MERKELLYEGKAKQVWSTDDPELVIQYFKDDATAFNAQKRGTIASKGVLNNAISERLFKLLADAGVKTHFVSRPSEREMLVKKLTIFPIEVVVRNVVAGSLAQRLGRDEGEKLPGPVVELYYKNDALGDPMINDSHAIVFGLATRADLDAIVAISLRVNESLKVFFAERNLTLVDFKLEYGRAADGTILLGDEICPDTCRLWDVASGERLDKDRFRRDLGRVEEAYQEVYRRVVP